MTESHTKKKKREKKKEKQFTKNLPLFKPWCIQRLQGSIVTCGKNPAIAEKRPGRNRYSKYYFFFLKYFRVRGGTEAPTAHPVVSVVRSRAWGQDSE